MKTATTTESDTARISFSVRSKSTTYGDDSVFHEYLVVMRSGGRFVGVCKGPRRTQLTRAECRTAGYRRIRELKAHRLFIVEVSKKDIDIGEARSCRSCAIAQALWRNQERIGLPKWQWDFRVEPYGFMCHFGGIVLKNTQDYHADELATGETGMPEIVNERDGSFFVESMYEWAMHWDDWAESRSMTLAEWREEHKDDDSKPYKPGPCSFVLDITEMKVERD